MEMDAGSWDSEEEEGRGEEVEGHELCLPQLISLTCCFCPENCGAFPSGLAGVGRRSQEGCLTFRSDFAGDKERGRRGSQGSPSVSSLALPGLCLPRHGVGSPAQQSCSPECQAPTTGASTLRPLLEVLVCEDEATPSFTINSIVYFIKPIKNFLSLFERVHK